MSKKPFYITTTLPYVNSDPHIGFAMEIIRADIIARAKKIAGYEVFFNTGTDEHGVKIYQKAFNSNENTQVFVDRYATKFKELKSVLGLSDDIHFVRTTDPHHVSAAQEFWRRCDKNGFIYKKLYKTKYCPGCELEKTDVELDDQGRCFIHPTTELILIDEENYFFKFSAFQKPLLELYAENPMLVVPDFRFNEIKAFVGRGLEDFSISRLATKMPWGISVPSDDKHVMYVWFDALVNYVSTLGWPEDMKTFETFWKNGTPVQYCGKDNLRQQSAMWQAMLMAAKLPPTHAIVIDGFVTGDGGVKMSKSFGNTVDPLDIVKEYGTEALRYYVARELSPFEDSPFTMEKFREAYNAHLANGVGNLTSRIMKMAEVNIKKVPVTPVIPESYDAALARYDVKAASDIIWSKIGKLDALIQKEEPFKKAKDSATKDHATRIIEQLVRGLADVALLLEPILPISAEIIKKCVAENKSPAQPLFLRK
ncbi:MAG: methionine--tRNA ligase [Candidatus Taylorbacteria bacterium RIFCSPHIGHO2_01_FULL_44_110]|uniref:Methionine--tRNA ligase n=1 Tax=Candidatus Taylorbacteria bacterium RIFCSPHIGHO2_12_FULL_45_16 TaxID=1802315 RepID=A0A1G2N0S9_9BACT|nr:MAG: methionine--tRNA ligase [Candidatus Taylorbacteria bacterium RIFCSPHIGHO2_01_FULL_44_110]OHA28811.1 MAG: methionine--tRNA ligase [Candidatus Taylorbacteria bacterium RIFCSPHIGHO2_12_FULL_45_16]OHA32870.1 MAG: methionine--tRNA ligase [Candidatus Taylorbacteria bacterium RIFCSPLOWO2_01_FULL_45_59]OHA38634.1 MAG: methionine--tRNA ligase [Candidatus Taylorbacteria bacterium RIFCSPLOWO2_02_FULL_45_10b]OHA43919.1 MAG: methionine--tRNA ligase [Candidatus Taylorbacteria bacterium RIFCSPLOWO2_12